MEVNKQPKLLFQGVDFINVVFDAKQPFDTEEEIVTSIVPKLHIDEDDPGSFLILMEVNLKIEGFFFLGLTAIGHFEIEGEVAERALQDDFMNANAPAIVFPYVRAFVSTFTSLLGASSETIVIPTQFFKGPLEKADI